MTTRGPILRIFEARTKPGLARDLLAKFSATSAAVVAGEPGNLGYIFGSCLEGDGNTVFFVSLWQDLAAVQARFGEDWQVSYMPDGYADMIEECSVRHLDATGGWHVQVL